MRRQLPVHSPLSFNSIVRAAVSAGAPWAEPPHDALIELLRERYRADRIVLTGSGTQALTLAIQIATRQGTNSVALPAFTCYDVATAAVGANAPVLLYDMNPETLGPDWESLERTLQNGAKAVVAAYLYGIPLEWDRIEALADHYGATVIEDAAQGLGGEWRGRPLGTLATTMSVLSFGRGKGWTGGRGGALLLRSEPGEETTLPRPGASRPLSTAARAAGQWLLARPFLYGLPYRIPWLHLGKTLYRDPRTVEGMDTFAAALALSTAHAAQQHSRARRAVAARLLAGIRHNPPVIVPTHPDDALPGYLRLPCRVIDDRQRKHVLETLGSAGVATGYPSSLRDLPALAGCLGAADPMPQADELARQLVTLPTHALLRERDISRLVSGIAELGC